MSIQEDINTQPQRSLAQWEQYPTSNSGYQWTCNLCNSIFGTLEQREKHQHECPGRNLPSHQSDWDSSVSSRQPAPLYGRADIPQKYYPPITQPQMQGTAIPPPPQLPVSMYQPSTTPAMYQPSTTPAMYQPSTTPAMYQPSTTPAMYQPSTTPAMYQPSTTPAMYQPSTTPAMYQQSTTPAMYQPSTTPAMYQPSTTPAMYQQSTTPAMCQPSTTPAMYQPSTTPAMYQPSTTPAMYQPSTTPAMYQHTSTDPEHPYIISSATYNHSAATAPEYQHTIASATYQHKTKELAYENTPGAFETWPAGRKVELYWIKESPTLDLQVTYIDEVYGGIVLQWNSNSEIFEGAAELSLGQHSGCLTLTTNDTILPIKHFFVEQGGPAPQKIMISTGQRRVVTPQTVISVEPDRGRVTSEEKRSQQENIYRLTADLDNRNNELAQQRQENVTYKQENADLTQQVELLLKENNMLRTAGKPVVSIPIEIETLHLKIQVWETKHTKLEKEVIKFKEEKNAAKEYSDYLYQQKQLFEDKLQEVLEKFNKSQIQISELKANLQEFGKDENDPPPLPTRCKPVLKEETQSADQEVKEAEN